MIDKLLRISLDEIEAGYEYQPHRKTFTCLACGKEFEMGEMFTFDGRFYDASKAILLHIEREHGSMLDILTSFDKKYTGITENQRELLSLIHQGLSDKEIASQTGVAPSTIRHQRFVFREKAKQAKLYLAIFDVVEKAAAERKTKVPEDELVNIHSGARMVDDRYFISKAEEDKTIAAVFESLQPLKLKVFSHKEKKKIVILRRIAEEFVKDRRYAEKEVNAILKAIYEDYATIRRYLIEYGFMERTNDCREYWKK